MKDFILGTLAYFGVSFLFLFSVLWIYNKYLDFVEKYKVNRKSRDYLY